MKLIVKRFFNNHLPLPQYKTAGAGCFDLAACLTRVCKLAVPRTGKYQNFTCDVFGGRNKLDDLLQYEVQRKKDVLYRCAAENEDKAVQLMLANTQHNVDGIRVVNVDPLPNPENTTGLSLHIAPRETILIPIGIQVRVPLGYSMLLFLRSSSAGKRYTLANGTGVVDSDYRGDIFAAMHNRTDDILNIEHGESIVQGMLIQTPQCTIEEGEIERSERGSDGFGSTDKRAVVIHPCLLAEQFDAVDRA